MSHLTKTRTAHINNGQVIPNRIAKYAEREREGEKKGDKLIKPVIRSCHLICFKETLKLHLLKTVHPAAHHTEQRENRVKM